MAPQQSDGFLWMYYCFRGLTWFNYSLWMFIGDIIMGYNYMDIVWVNQLVYYSVICNPSKKDAKKVIYHWVGFDVPKFWGCYTMIELLLRYSWTDIILRPRCCTFMYLLQQFLMCFRYSFNVINCFFFDVILRIHICCCVIYVGAIYKEFQVFKTCDDYSIL